MSYSNVIKKIEEVLSSNSIGLMRITDVSTVEITAEDLARGKEEGIGSAGRYRIISIQAAVPVAD